MMKKFIPTLLTTATGFFAVTTRVLAASSDLGIDDRHRPNAAVASDFSTAAVQFINYFLMFLGLLVVSMIIYAGVLLVTAQGEEEQINKGKKIILYAVIGMIVIMLSFAIVRLVAGAGDVIA